MKVKVLTAFICVLFLARTVCAQNQYFLSQVANGRAGSQSFRTTFTLFNNSDVSATILVKLTDDYANPLPVTRVPDEFSLGLRHVPPRDEAITRHTEVRASGAVRIPADLCQTRRLAG